MKKTILRSALITTLFFAPHLQAFELSKQAVHATVNLNMPNANGIAKKQITLMNIKLTAKEKETILQRLPRKINFSNSGELPAAVNLGMNKVPVLDQGQHGTCVTFASTAAVDALIGKGDYVSQLCSLELGAYFEEKGYMPSGWEGTFGPMVLDQLFRFGYVNQTNQRKNSCAGVFEYPATDEADTGKTLTLDEFKKQSENMVDKDNFPAWAWTPLLNVFDRFYNPLKDAEDIKRVLTNIKQSLANGHRVTFGAFLMTSKVCNDIACASYHVKNDTWALTPSIVKNPVILGGHEMVITGYDDNAVASDAEGVKHTGLLILRNSWSQDAGDNGNYYMTYDYFMKLAIEAQKVMPLDEEKTH